MERRRCRWVNLKNPRYIRYHDEEWGRPHYDDGYLFELLVLESFQAGLSWECILNKRESFRTAFDGFDCRKVAAYTQEKMDALAADPSIVRNRRKIAAAVNNARIFLTIQEEFGSFSNYLWHFTRGEQVVHRDGLLRASSPLSDAVSRDLKGRGMRFVGSVIIYSYLQAAGIIDDHEPECDFCCGRQRAKEQPLGIEERPSGAGGRKEGSPAWHVMRGCSMLLLSVELMGREVFLRTHRIAVLILDSQVDSLLPVGELYITNAVIVELMGDVQLLSVIVDPHRAVILIGDLRRVEMLHQLLRGERPFGAVRLKGHTASAALLCLAVFICVLQRIVPRLYCHDCVCLIAVEPKLHPALDAPQVGRISRTSRSQQECGREGDDCGPAAALSMRLLCHFHYLRQCVGGGMQWGKCPLKPFLLCHGDSSSKIVLSFALARNSLVLTVFSGIRSMDATSAVEYPS